jgi:hypothetical protein
MAMLRDCRSLRVFIVVGLVLAWLVANNHCAFASSDARTATSDRGGMPSGCPMHAKQQPAPVKPNSCGDLPCCNNLQATPTVAAKLMTNPLWSGFFVAFLTAQFDAADSFTARVAFFSDTGPPGETSFAELVLQRSLLAHAPPVSLS